MYLPAWIHWWQLWNRHQWVLSFCLLLLLLLHVILHHHPEVTLCGWQDVNLCSHYNYSYSSSVLWEREGEREGEREREQTNKWFIELGQQPVSNMGAIYVCVFVCVRACLCVCVCVWEREREREREREQMNKWFISLCHLPMSNWEQVWLKEIWSKNK